ncbi:MAG: C25 family cysteine peptidase [Dinoroseobacter sp.]|nr:C25 family cysteine peptidase [Dinoroseobacter sp.]
MKLFLIGSMQSLVVCRGVARRLACALASVLTLLLPASGLAQTMTEGPLPLSSTFSDDGTELEISWKNAMTMRVLNSEVYRRPFGATGPQSWQLIEPKLGREFLYRDKDVGPGMAYEYKVMRYDTDLVDVGYLLAGTDVPAIEARGRAFVVVDETIAAPLAAPLERFIQDLTGDGWAVTRHDVPRGTPRDPTANLAAAQEIRRWIADQYQRDVYRDFTLILVGHVPVVYSGRASPDGHEAKPHPTDLFYADMNGVWPEADPGRLSPDLVPSHFIEFPVGRIDFSNMGDGSREAEISMLRAYFDKNHHWRHGMLGDLREAYGQTGYLRVEIAQLDNLVGSASVTEGGHHDIGEQKPWLFGVDFGDWKGANYAGYTNKAVFSINFGSAKQYFANRNNAIRGMLIQPWYGLASGWGGRPSWRLHAMALGGTIGLAHLKTVNNGRKDGEYREAMEYIPTGKYLWRNPIWVNLMGDPTLRAFPTVPPSAVQVEPDPSGAIVRWTESGDPDLVGYTVYRQATDGASFAAISEVLPAGTREFVDPEGTTTTLYMLRAVSRKVVAAGSFFSLSQGAFARAGHSSLPKAPSAQTIEPGVASELGLKDDPDAGVLRAFIDGVDGGDLVRDETGSWSFTPGAGATGAVNLRFSEWDGLASREQVFELSIKP